MPQILKNDDLYVVTISSFEERDKLYNFCVSNNIPILYKEIFTSKKLNHLYGISKTGVGLIGTMVARNIPKDRVINGSDL